MREHDTQKVAIYCRTARVNPSEIELQKENLTRYALELGYNGFLYYADDGVSGHNYDRPGLCELEKDIAAGTIAAVLVKDIARIGRDVVRTRQWINSLAHQGIQFIAADHSHEMETSLASEKFMELLRADESWEAQQMM